MECTFLKNKKKRTPLFVYLSNYEKWIYFNYLELYLICPLCPRVWYRKIKVSPLAHRPVLLPFSQNDWLTLTFSKWLCIWTWSYKFCWPLCSFLFVDLDFLLQLVSCHINNVSSILEQNHSNTHHLWNLALLMITPS